MAGNGLNMIRKYIINYLELYAVFIVIQYFIGFLESHRGSDQ